MGSQPLLPTEFNALAHCVLPEQPLLAAVHGLERSARIDHRVLDGHSLIDPRLVCGIGNCGAVTTGDASPGTERKRSDEHQCHKTAYHAACDRTSRPGRRRRVRGLLGLGSRSSCRRGR